MLAADVGSAAIKQDLPPGFSALARNLNLHQLIYNTENVLTFICVCQWESGWVATWQGGVRFGSWQANAGAQVCFRFGFGGFFLIRRVYEHCLVAKLPSTFFCFFVVF